MTREPKVLIVGPGRSGTSTVARICHENLGISMGRFLRPPDQHNRYGYYEDYVSHSLVRCMVDRVLEPFDYLDIMLDINIDHHHGANLTDWGAKDPWFLHLQDHQLIELEPELGILCFRNAHDAVASWEKVNDTVPSRAHLGRHEFRTERMHEIERGIWSNVLSLDFSTQQDEKELEQRIRESLREGVRV